MGADPLPSESLETSDADKKPVANWREGLTREYVTREVLLGITIAFAQIPESVAFAYMANIKPPIALHAAWMVGLICSIFGGRPGMVNGATGAFAAIIGTFIPSAGVGENGPGVETLFPSVMLAGCLMVLAGLARLERFILLLPQSVITGFCNGLAIVIGLAQLHPFQDSKTHDWKTGTEFWIMLVICLASMCTMEFVPKLPFKILKVIPSSLLAIVVACIIEFAIVRPAGLVDRPFDAAKPCLDRLDNGRCRGTMTIKDVSEFTSETRFPIPFFVPHGSIRYDIAATQTSDALLKIFIQGILLTLVGSIESLLTAEVVESFTKEPGDGQKTLLAMGAGNILSGFFGGMGGNAMIGLSTVSCLGGGKGRLAPTVTALVILICVVGAYDVLNFIPVSALAGIMLVVVLHTFKWFSLKMLLTAVLPQFMLDKLGLKKTVPRYEVVVIFAVTIVANFPKGTNIAYAVFVGSAISAWGYAWASGNAFDIRQEQSESGQQKKIVNLDGPLFFTYANRLSKVLKPDTDPAEVEVRLSSALTPAMDFTGIHVLGAAAAEYTKQQKTFIVRAVEPNKDMWDKSSMSQTDAEIGAAGSDKIKVIGKVSIDPY